MEPFTALTRSAASLASAFLFSAASSFPRATAFAATAALLAALAAAAALLAEAAAALTAGLERGVVRATVKGLDDSPTAAAAATASLRRPSSMAAP